MRKPTRSVLRLALTLFLTFLSITTFGACKPNTTNIPANGLCEQTNYQVSYESKVDGNWQIFVTNIDGSKKCQLTDGDKDNHAPQWSPDGKQLVFAVTDRYKTSHIALMNVDGSNLHNLTKSEDSNNDSPYWSPDGKHLVFVSDRPWNSALPVLTREIYIMDADGSNQTRLTDDSGNISNPLWSPDNQHISFFWYNQNDIGYFLINPDGSNRQRLTGGYKSGAITLLWSPDGKYIAFTLNESIYLMNADGSNQHNLTNNTQLGTYDKQPSWSPDGKQIVFITVIAS